MTSMRARFVHQSTQHVFELEGVSIVGRSADATVPAIDPKVSRRHAMIRQQADGFWLFDLGSFNGSVINGARITGARKLCHGDLIEIGNQVYQFEQEGEAAEPVESFLDESTEAHIRSSEIILLVSDIQGYTRLSERLSPEQLAPIIGTWYARTEEILAQYGGILDKFIGDCVLAYWTDTSVAARLRVFDAARAMLQSCIETYDAHRELLEDVGLAFGSGVGIHLGRVVYGGLSSQEFSLIGDPVNVAFRLEALTREAGYPVLTSEEFLRDWPDGVQCCTPLGSHTIRGREATVEVYALEHLPGDC